MERYRNHIRGSRLPDWVFPDTPSPTIHDGDQNVLPNATFSPARLHTLSDKESRTEKKKRGMKEIRCSGKAPGRYALHARGPDNQYGTPATTHG